MDKYKVANALISTTAKKSVVNIADHKLKLH